MQGSKVKNLRSYLALSKKELAKLASVSTKAVDSLENNRPLSLDEKRKILAQLYINKASKFK